MKALLVVTLLFGACGARSSQVHPARVDGAGEATTCEGLEQQYAAALQQARVCDPRLSVMPCTQRVADRLACSCLTYVNRVRAEAIAELGRLQRQWTDSNCEPETCPAIGCVGPHGAACVPDAAPASRAGRCESNR